MRALLLTVFAAALLAPARASACSCRAPGDPATELAHADAVFEGTVTSIDPVHVSSTMEWARSWFGFKASDDYGTRVHFSVSRSWKGVTTTTETIATGVGGGDCGMSFDKGRDYVVYAYSHREQLWTGMCSRTSTVADAAEDLTFLQTQPALARTTAPAASTRWFLIFAALALALVSSVLAIRRYNRAR